MHLLLKIFTMGSLVLAGSTWGPLHVDAHSRVTAPAPTCQANQLSIVPATVSGATGHIAMEMRLRNIATQSCALQGYPTLILLDGSRHPLPTVLTWGSSYFRPLNRPVRLVTLAPQGIAFLALGWAHIPKQGRQCPPAPNLLILPPGASTARLIAMGHPSAQSYGPIDACGGEVAVSPVEPTQFKL